MMVYSIIKIIFGSKNILRESSILFL